MEFQSSLQKLQRSPCYYYSSESTAIQITPWSFDSSQPKVLGRVREGGRWFDRQIRRLGSPAARNRWGKRERRPRRSSRYPWFAERRPEMGGPRQTGRRRRRQTTARVLQRGLGKGKWPGRCAGSRRSSLGCQHGRRSFGEVGSTAAWSLPVFCGWRWCVLGRGSEEQAKEGAEWS